MKKKALSITAATTLGGLTLYFLSSDAIDPEALKLGNEIENALKREDDINIRETSLNNPNLDISKASESSKRSIRSAMTALRAAANEVMTECPRIDQAIEEKKYTVFADNEFENLSTVLTEDNRLLIRLPEAQALRRTSELKEKFKVLLKDTEREWNALHETGLNRGRFIVTLKENGNGTTTENISHLIKPRPVLPASIDVSETNPTKTDFLERRERALDDVAYPPMVPGISRD